MAFNVKEFSSKLQNTNGISRRAHFEIQILLPQKIFGGTAYSSEHLTLTGVSSNIPSLSLDLTEIRRSTISYKESFPTNINFGDLSVTFLSDAKGQNLSVFKEWMNYIYRAEPIVQDTAFRLPYKNDYATTTLIKHFDPEGKVIAEYKFNEVFPINIGDISMNWGALNDLLDIQVVFKYSTYSIKTGNSLNPTPSKNVPIKKQPAENNRIPENPIYKP